MLDERVLTNNDIKIESRLTRVEVTTKTLHEDMKDVKRSLKWLIGLVFSMNMAIIGLLAKGFNIV
jgi:hypothetical protein